MKNKITVDKYTPYLFVSVTIHFVNPIFHRKKKKGKKVCLVISAMRPKCLLVPQWQ